MTNTSDGRLEAIDGLRGIAALLVVVFHIQEAISRTATGWLWTPLDLVVRNGFLGVDIFFVISGFVIALSVNKGAPTFAYFGRFILRRSIRLDPPYWAAIALELLLMFVTRRVFGEIKSPYPSVKQLAAHVFYMQDLLGFGGVVVIFWTLCYEIQFYLFYVGARVSFAKFPAFFSRPAVRDSALLALFAFSLWARFWHTEPMVRGLAIDRWYQFFLGVLTWQAVTQPKRIVPLMLAWVAIVGVILGMGVSLVQLLVVGVSALILLAVRSELVQSALSARPLVWLGGISYSLYLYHSSIAWRFISLSQKLVPGSWGAATAVGFFTLGVLVSVATAAVLCELIERPCLRLCRRVRLPCQATSGIDPLATSGIDPLR